MNNIFHTSPATTRPPSPSPDQDDSQHTEGDQDQQTDPCCPHQPPRPAIPLDHIIRPGSGPVPGLKLPRQQHGLCS